MSHIVKFHLILWVFFAFACRCLPETMFHSHHEGSNRFGTGDEVKGHRQGAAVVEVGEPEFGSGELPLHVRIILQVDEGQENEKSIRTSGFVLLDSGD